jgi:hypothetical protein
MVDMAKRIYFVVDCKTPGCRNVCAVKSHEDCEGQKEVAEIFPNGFSHECGLCHRTHRYERDEIRMELFDFAPPAER